jgi:Glycosyl hydrolases family 2, sugar binding domain.
MMRNSWKQITVMTLGALACMGSTKPAMAQQPIKEQVQYLSGADAKHTQVWDFMVTGGRNSNQWTSIAVPSHWEQQGFGTYNYGRDNVTFGKNFVYANEQGFYKRSFMVNAHWKGQQIFFGV